MEQLQFHYDFSTEILMRRLADASQHKIYPAVIPKTEIPLRKILLTTRLWNHVRKQQALLTIATDDWLFTQQPTTEQDILSFTTTTTEEAQVLDIPPEEEQESFPLNTADSFVSTVDWNWLDSPEPSLKRASEDQLEQTTFKKSKPSNATFDNLMNNILVSSA